MPSIKLKKKTQEYLAEKERSKQNVVKDPEPEPQPEPEPEKIKKISKEPKPKPKEKAPVDIPQILEKRKRSVPPGEQKLTDW